MCLIGGRRQSVCTRDGIVHVITQSATGGFSTYTTCGVDWRRSCMYAPDVTVVNCMTCLVHETRE